MIYIKKSLMVIAIMVMIINTLASSSGQGFTHQAVIRDHSGNPLSDQELSINISIIQGSLQGSVVFDETHTTQANEAGMITISVGSINSLEHISWAEHDFFLELNIGDSIIIQNQLLSVPYALYAYSSIGSFSGNYHDLTNVPNIDAFLNIYDAVPGDLAFFDGNNWHVLAIGQDGEVLKTIYGEPKWVSSEFIPTSVTDIDGNVYPTIQIGNQEWMAANLRVTRYATGAHIPTGLSNTDWASTSSGAYGVYPHNMVEGIGSDEAMINAYGKLYNWYSTVDERGLCPAGWRVPSDSDWLILTGYILDNYDDIVAEDLGNALKSCRQVNSPAGGACNTNVHPRWNSDHNHFGTDEFGFSLLPAGYRHFNGSYDALGASGLWWSNTTSGPTTAWYHYLNFDWGCFYRFNVGWMGYGFSVRCIKNEQP